MNQRECYRIKILRKSFNELQKKTALGKKQIRAKLVPFHRKKNPTDIGLVKISSTENFSPLPHSLSGYFPQEVTPLN